MANHLRRQIREQVGTTLTGLTTTGSNVYQSRVYPLEDSNLPALLIYTKEESSEPLSIHSNRVLVRNLSLVVEAYVKAVSDFDDTIDTIAKEVEQAIASDITLSGKAKDTFLAETNIEFNAEGEKPVAYCSFIFNVEYYTKEQNPDVAL
jgi:hypothetical protein|tara:strand:- start:4079 stop:4525 length:447 start_codon:yes stop_codon:yes gene_type:complete